MRRAAAVLAIAALAAMGGCGNGKRRAAPRSTPGYPDSMAVLGHSFTTGWNTDPDRPQQDAPENSWAAGTNPAVDSVYERILARNPAIRGHVWNLGQDGAGVYQFAAQAQRVAELQPSPELLLVQIGDNDVACPPSTADLAGFANGVAGALRTAAAGAPRARILVLSRLGSPEHFIKPCARSERILGAYARRLAAACEQTPRCVTDGGANSRVDLRPGDLQPNGHPTLAGHRLEAATVWRVLRRLGIVP